jgi:hypothetical protein
MSNQQPDYLAYLLRLWRHNDEEQTNWRASIESSHSGNRHVFANLDDLVTFLRLQMGLGHDESEQKDAPKQG